MIPSALRLKRIRLADLRVGIRALADSPFLSGVIYLDQTEAGPEALVPFEVIQKRPVEIPPYIRAFFDRLVHPGEVLSDKCFPLLVCSIGEAVFRNVNWELVALEVIEDIENAFGIDFPAEIRLSKTDGMRFFWKPETVMKVVLNREVIVMIAGQEKHQAIGKKPRDPNGEMIEW